MAAVEKQAKLGNTVRVLLLLPPPHPSWVGFYNLLLLALGRGSVQVYGPTGIAEPVLGVTKPRSALIGKYR